MFGIQDQTAFLTGHGSPCLAFHIPSPRRCFLDHQHLLKSCPSVRFMFIAHIALWGACCASSSGVPSLPFPPQLFIAPACSCPKCPCGLVPWTALWWCCIDWISCLLCSTQLPVWKTELLELFSPLPFSHGHFIPFFCCLPLLLFSLAEQIQESADNLF